jgi:hypothetical protein
MSQCTPSTTIIKERKKEGKKKKERKEGRRGNRDRTRKGH